MVKNFAARVNSRLIWSFSRWTQIPFSITEEESVPILENGFHEERDLTRKERKRVIRRVGQERDGVWRDKDKMRVTQRKI